MRVVGTIVIVQEDRIRLVDASGHGYLFVVRKRAATAQQLERWRDQAEWLEVEYDGQPDRGAVAISLRSASPAG